MARIVPEREIAPILDAARTWIDRCLVEDRAIFGDTDRWTAGLVAEVRAAFVDNPDLGKDSFRVKLRGQLATVSVEAKALAAEMIWVLLLFPSNITPAKKREQLLNMLRDAGCSPDVSEPMLADRVLNGIGSAGTAYNTHRPRELGYLLQLTGQLKNEPVEQRRKILSDYDQFLAWIETVPTDGSRQFRQMLRYFAFPDRVERMSSSGNQRKILADHGVVREEDSRAWTERQIDDALSNLRRRWESQYPGQVLDFYRPPLKPEARDEALVLLGTWKELDNRDFQRVQQWIHEHEAWATWWSFPIRDPFPKDLAGRSFHVYVNTGGNQITHRLTVEEFETSSGNDGLETPWPDMTFPEYRNATRNGPSHSEIFKTWLKCTSFEALSPELTTDDFEPAAGTQRESLLNQSAFGYAKRKTPTGTRPPAGDRPETETATRRKVATNLILYGPPGTGKTHWMQQKFAEYTETPISLDEDAWRRELVAAFGWREVIAAALSEMRKSVRVAELAGHPLVLAKLAERSLADKNLSNYLWANLQAHTPESVATVNYRGRRPPFLFRKSEDSVWSLLPDWRDQDREAGKLADMVHAGRTATSSPIQRYRVVTFHPSYSYEDFVRGIRPVAQDDGSTRFQLVDGVFKQLCDAAKRDPAHRWALFIDEINRANIAKVFGELITLVEPNKRANYDAEGRLVGGLEVQLPGSVDSDVTDPPFAVPANLDLYGTMNTADRSIALLDIALRRRFEFREMEPNFELMPTIGAVNLGLLLRRINDRLEYLLDRDHRVGHAYFMHARTTEDLRSAFRTQLIPLLQEYFFDDLSRVALVLQTSAKAAFLVKEELAPGLLFSGQDIEPGQDARFRYLLTEVDTWTEASFVGIYDEVAAANERS